MTQAALAESRPSHVRLIAVISAAHFVSHYYILILAPLLPFVREAYGVSYTEIGLALTTFNVVTGALQTPAGFLVDWLGARVILIIGLLIGATAFVVVGMVDSFWVLVAMFGLAGVGNTVYHPADYTLLSQHVPAERIGQAFSIHTFAGMMGSAFAPTSLLMMQSVWGWRAAFIGAGLFGFAVAAILMLVRDNAPAHAAAPVAKASEDKPAEGWRLLMTAPILMNMFFFVLIAMISGGMFNYSVVALGALYGTPPAVANSALSSLLLLSAFGVLVGGVIATRVSRHAWVAALGLAAMALTAALVAQVDMNTVLLVLVMTAFGFFYGIIMPSRDMIVREVTPPGSFGKVFGFVTTGFNIGGIVSPLIFGAIMDHSSPRLVFVAVAAFALLSVFTVISLPKKPA
ncbi:MAG TPA: MFS transporter [Xanthobacteraceae bacterium]|nr:MFS transporter [Xanthobacteraceae bacterium]